MADLKDRVSIYPRRIKITPEGGGAPYYITWDYADYPSEVGTLLNKDALLSDAAASAVGLESGSTLPSDAFIKVAGDISGKAAATHASRHASGGADALAPADIGAAALENGVVKASQAKTLYEFPEASFTLLASQAEETIFANSASAIVVTLPSSLSVDNGTAFNFVRWGAGAVSFVAGSGAWICAPNNVLSISAQYASALAVKITDEGWWVVCG